MKPGSPLIVAHHGIPQAEGGKLRWRPRYAAFAAASGIVWPDARKAVEAIELFYAGFTFRGWVAYAPS